MTHIQYIKPALIPSGLGPMSHIVEVDSITKEAGEEDQPTTITLRLTEEDGKWFAIWNPKKDSDEYERWELHSESLLEAIQETWSELCHEDFITSYAVTETIGFRIGKP